MMRPGRNIRAVLGLFFVAPLIAEFLLGNLSLKLLPALIVLAPMYGGGAVLIRETTRRASRGWRSMLLLGAAYTLIEEGFVTQSLFNPNYLGMHMHLLDPAYIPVFGIGAWWTLFMFNLHVFWSIAVSIVLVEALVPAQAEQPWLGRTGDAIVAVLFLFGLIVNARFSFRQHPFVASHAQLISAGVVCFGLIGCAFLLPLRGSRVVLGVVPSPWLTGCAALLLGVSVLITPPRWGWGAVAVLLLIDVCLLVLVWLFSRRIRWSSMHTLSLGAGGALAYGLHAFIETPVAGGTGMLARVGNAIFLLGAVGLILAGARRTSRAVGAATVVGSAPAS
jgi:hypothetical protein